MNDLCGKFIVFEGVDFSGKSTQSLFLTHNLLHRKGVPVTLTREPGSEHLNVTMQIRKMLQITNSKDILTTAFLFLADRRYHMTQWVKPSIECGMTVISDRFYYTTMVYQKDAFPELLKFNIMATDGLFPDMVIFIDVKPEVILERRKQREVLEINDDLPISKIEEMRLSYISILKQEYISGRIGALLTIVDDGTLTQEELSEKIYENVLKSINY